VKHTDDPGYVRELHRFWDGRIWLRVTAPSGNFLERRFRWTPTPTSPRSWRETRWDGSMDNMARSLVEQEAGL
jgi:hypothetical protein